MNAPACRSLKFDLGNAYERVTDCLLRDKNCRDGARMDVMHSQLGFGAIALDSERLDLFCRPSRVVEVYPACRPEGEQAEQKCRAHVEAARRAGDAKVTPLYPR
jgi:hypothetical protein